MWWRGIKECKECWNQEMCILPGQLASKRLNDEKLCITYQFLFVVLKLCTNKTHSYKHNEQINKQDIDNFECLGVTLIRIYSTHTITS
jgi:hypothetical protein